jgi:hypothetical protein
MRPKQLKGSGKHWKPLSEVPPEYNQKGKKKKFLKKQKNKRSNPSRYTAHNYW